ncbi:MAG: two-component regulator propeller domain-containing protein, partial [Oscillospiraceae bacterium]
MKKNKAISKILSIALVLTIIFSSAFIASSANNNDFAAKHTQTQYNDKNGLPDNSINDILATSDGMMWFASSSGLIKYNSKNFQLINKNNSNDYGAINAVKLFEDSQKRLWIGTNDGGIICKSKTQTKTINMKPWAASNSVKDIKELSTGVIVVATNKGVFYIDNDFNVNSVGVMPGKRQDASASLNVNMLAVNFKDNILGVTANGNLFSIVEGKAELHNKLFKEYKLTCIYLIGNNIFRIGTTSGDIIDLTYNENKEYSIKITKTTGNSISSMYKDSNDIWWVLTDTKIGYLDEKSTYVEVNNLHIDKYINTMYEDYQGNYWFGSNTYGVLKLSASSFVNYNNIYSLPKFLATAVTHFDDKTYIATDSGLKVINEKSRENVENTLTKLLKNKKINDLRTDLNNNIWIATEDSGLIKYSKDGAIKAFTVADGMLGTAVQKVFMGTNDKVLVGTSEGISIISNNKIIHNYKCNENIGSSVISIYEDSQSRIYIGTENEGVKKIDVDGTISNIIKAEGNPPGNVSSVIKDPNKDGVWASIGSSLCYVTTDGKVKKIEKLSLSRAIVDIFFTPDGNMWVVTPSEVLVLNTDNLLSDNEKLVVTRLNKSSGLYSNVYQLSHNFLSPEGILYLCCDEGINTINTLDYKISQPIPKITLNVVASETKAYPSSGKIKLSAEEEKLSFNVSVLSYSEYSDCKISYMLEGL